MTAIPTFGNEIKNTEFTLKDGVVFVNHGSYGVVPKRVQQAQDRQDNNNNIYFKLNTFMDYVTGEQTYDNTRKVKQKA